MANLHIQDLFLNNVRKGKVEVTIFLVNGVQIKGIITAFDNFVVVISVGSKQQMIYKHAISTLLSAKAVSFTE